jgi:AAA family ATP:ADP antiporter
MLGEVAVTSGSSRPVAGAKFWRVFGDVRAGEGSRVALLGLQVFLLLTAYYLLKTVREPLILLWGIWGLEGDELKIYATSAQALVLLAVVPLYARLAARIPRLALVRVTLLVFIASLLVFTALGAGEVPIAAPFYVWLGIVSLLSIAQFWSLANDLHSREAGERLFGVIAIGGSLGAIVGAQIARQLIGPVGIYGVMGIAAAVYGLALVSVTLVERGTGPATAEARRAPAAPRTRGALALVLRDRYLVLIGALLIIANLVNTQGEFILADAVKAHADVFPAREREAVIGRFYGAFYGVVNAVAFVVQALIVARVLRRRGARWALFLMPSVALGGYAAIALVPALAVVAIAKAAENSFDYSMEKTVEQTLFLPTTREIKYTGMATLDTLCVRLGDLAAGGLVLVFLHVAGLSRRGFAVANILLVALWLAIVVRIARRHRRLAGAALAAGLVVALAGGNTGCAGTPAVRTFPDRPVAWHEHDAEDVATRPRPSDLGELDWTLLLRDDVAGEVDRVLALEGARPARDVNAVDEVPCSTWFCPRNHLDPMTPEEIAAGPPGPAPRPPLRIVKGKDRGAALGFEVVDAEGRKYLLKLDPVGHPGIATSAELTGTRLFHAAGYNVPPDFALELGPDDLVVDPGATYKLYGVQKRPLTADIVRADLARAARLPDGRLRAVAVAWLPGQVLGASDMIGRRADDPNDRIPHQDRRSLRAAWMLAAWLAVFDASAINTLDSYVEENGRRFVRHYVIDFGAGLGSATTDSKGPHQGGQHLVEVGRTLASALSLGLYRRHYQSQRGAWREEVAAHPVVGWFPAEGFDVESFRTNRKVPAHQRMTDRDAYWGAKLVTSFSDAQLAAVAATARLDPGETAYLSRALAVRRDVIGRRYLTAMTAVEAPAVIGNEAAARVCFDDLNIARGYVSPAHVRYAVSLADDRGRRRGEVKVAASGARTCMPATDVARGYRVIAVAAERDIDGTRVRAQTSRIHTRDGRVVGLDRDE